MSILAAIQEAVETTATRPLDEPLVIQLPPDEWLGAYREMLERETPARYWMPLGRVFGRQRIHMDTAVGAVHLEPQP